MVEYSIIKERVSKHITPNFKRLEIYKAPTSQSYTLRVLWRPIDSVKPYITSIEKHEDIINVCEKLKTELGTDYVDSSIIPEYVTIKGTPINNEGKIKIGTLVEDENGNKKVITDIIECKKKASMIKVGGSNIINVETFKSKYTIIDNINNYIKTEYTDKKIQHWYDVNKTTLPCGYFSV